MDARKNFGNEGEALAADFLRSKGWEILEYQYKKRFGEIDLICRDGAEIVFVEVKSRHTTILGDPEDAVTPEKIRHLLRAADQYMLDGKLIDRPWRIDVVAIEYDHVPPRITHIENIDIPESFW